MSDFDLYEGQNCKCGNDPACTACGANELYEAHMKEVQERLNEQAYFEVQLEEDERAARKYWWKDDSDPNPRRKKNVYEEGTLFTRDGKSLF